MGRGINALYAIRLMNELPTVVQPAMAEAEAKRCLSAVAWMRNANQFKFPIVQQIYVVVGEMLASRMTKKKEENIKEIICVGHRGA